MIFEPHSSHSLIEFLAVVSGHHDEQAAADRAASWTAAHFDADISAVVIDGELSAAVGFGTETAAAGRLGDARPGQSSIRLPGLGACEMVAASWEDASGGRLIVIRVDAPFTLVERDLLSGLARVFGCSLRGIAALGAERRLELERSIDVAFHDPLTGLPNRTLFLDRLAHALHGWARRGDGLSVLFIDLDRFKAVNDTLGHAAGDELLRMVAERLQECVRDSDTTARIGADEFAAVLEGVGSDAQTEQVAQRIVEAISLPFRVEEREVFIGATVGIAHAAGDETIAHELLRNADLAMCSAKKAGGGRHATYRPEMRATLLERFELERDLRRALERGELSVAYQPLVDLASEHPVGVEALVRWNHPVRGSVSPRVFIPIAEEIGTIGEIGRWVLAQSCRQVATLRELHPELTLNVNLSAGQLEDEALPEHVEQALATSGLPGAALTLEITESVLVRGRASVAARLERLRAGGVSIAVDDFGIGYSSLGYLRDFPIDALKIDKFFVDEVGTKDGERSLVEAMVRLAHTMRVQTIAEGIETAEQLDCLCALRCETGQGFLFSRPLSAPKLTDYLARAGRPSYLPRLPRGLSG